MSSNKGNFHPIARETNALIVDFQATGKTYPVPQQSWLRGFLRKSVFMCASTTFIAATVYLFFNNGLGNQPLRFGFLLVITPLTVLIQRMRVEWGFTWRHCLMPLGKVNSLLFFFLAVVFFWAGLGSALASLRIMEVSETHWVVESLAYHFQQVYLLFIGRYFYLLFINKKSFNYKAENSLALLFFFFVVMPLTWWQESLTLALFENSLPGIDLPSGLPGSANF